MKIKKINYEFEPHFEKEDDTWKRHLFFFELKKDFIKDVTEFGFCPYIQKPCSEQRKDKNIMRFKKVDNFARTDYIKNLYKKITANNFKKNVKQNSVSPEKTKNNFVFKKNNSMKEIYYNILNYLEHYGFRMYKGKIWKYDPYIGYVIGIEVELTRWGTLNDVHVCASTYQSPIDENYTVKHEPLLKTWLHPCSYVREHEGISIYTMGHPNQSVDVTLKQQGEVLLPYLEKYFFPLLQFDETPEVFLKNLETMQIIECEARNGVLGVIRPELAMEYYRYGDIENALRIIDLNIIIY